MKVSPTEITSKSSEKLIRSLYRSLRKYGEGQDFLRRIIGVKDMRFFTYASKASQWHEKLRFYRFLHSNSLPLTMVACFSIRYYSWKLNMLRFYCILHLKRIPLASIIIFVSFLCMAQIYREIWTGIRQGQANETAKRRQIISIIEEMRRPVS